MSRKRIIGGLVALTMLGGMFLPAAAASAGEKVTICHIAGHAQPNNANEITITISINGWLNGHKDSTNDAAGHEIDSLGACDEEPPPPPPV